MKRAGFLLWMVMHCLVAIRSFGQTWLATGAPVVDANGYFIDWNTIAISADGAKVLAGSSGGTISPGPPVFYKSIDSGATWSAMTMSATNGSAVMSADGSEWMVMGNLSYVSTNDGVTWTAITGKMGITAASADLKTIYVAESSGFIWVSTNGAATWTLTPAKIESWESLACSADGMKAYAVNTFGYAGGGTLVVSTNYGQAWTDAASGVDSVACSTNGTKAVAVGTGKILVSTNSGATWTQLLNAPGPPGRLYVVAGCSPDGNRIMAMATSSTLFAGGAACFSSDFGATWRTNSFADREWRSVVVSADGRRWFAGDWDGGLWTLGANLAPVLDVKSRDVTLSWPVASTNFVVQSSSNLMAWTTLTNVPRLNWSNLQYEVTVPPANRFYRLRSP